MATRRTTTNTRTTAADKRATMTGKRAATPGKRAMTSGKRTMTLNLTEQEMRVVEQLAERKELTKTGVLRQALRMYQMVSLRFDRGERMYFENDHSPRKMKNELIVLS